MMKPNSRAFALPMVLLIVVAVTILVVGLFLTVTRERSASRTMMENEKAKFVARTALDHALALLDNIPQPKPPQKVGADPMPGAPGSLGSSIDATPTTNWITSPGLLTLVSGNQVKEIPLSSNRSAAVVAGPEGADLNRPLLDPDEQGNPVYPIIPPVNDSPVPLRVEWVYLLKNPNQPASKDNPVVARYAFWIDDDSTKLNVNCALGKPSGLDFRKPNPLMTDSLQGFVGTTSGRLTNRITVGSRTDSGGSGSTLDVDYPLWHFTSQNLDVLNTAGASVDAAALASAIHNAVLWSSSNRFEFHWQPLSTAAEISRFLTGTDVQKAGFLQENLFHLTSTGRSPEFQVFGKSRLFMDRLQPIVDNSLYFQMSYDQDGPIYTHAGELTAGQTNGSMPNGGFWSPSANGFIHAAWSLAHLLTRNDWPGMPSQSFVDKWGGDEAALREADQVAWNMAMMAAYSAGGERTNNATNLAEGAQPASALLVNRAVYSVDPRYGVAGFLNAGGRSGGLQARRLPGANGAGLPSPNGALFPGVLSGKAILPWYPAPQINEIALCVQAVDASTNPADSNYGKYWLRMWIEVDVHFGGPLGGDASRRMPTTKSNTSNRWSYRFQLTDVSYVISQSDGPSLTQTLPQNATSESDMNRMSGVLLGAAPNLAPHLFSGDYYRVAGGKTYARSTNSASMGDGSADSPVPSGAALFSWSNTNAINIDFRFRLAFGQLSNRDTLIQLIPVWDSLEQASSGSPCFVPPPGQTDRLAISMQIAPSLLSDGLGHADPTKVYSRSLEIADSRLAGNSNAWRPFQDWDGAGQADSASPPGEPPSDKLEGHRLGLPNWSELAASGDKSKIAYFDFCNAAYGSVFPRGSIGMLSVIPLGMQRGIPFETFRFQPSTSSAVLPDWLVLDLFAPALQPFSFMHSVMGKINPNAALTPAVPAERWKPLQALLENSDYPGTSGAPSPVVDNVLNYRFAGVDFGARGRYDYIGELCEIQGFADAGTEDWLKEGLIRNYANLLTTRSNSFTVWGIAQIIRKSPSGSNHGTFESGDRIVAEKRFRAEIERAVWPGVDGVPGNGSATDGVYTKVAEPAGSPDYNKQRNSAFGRFIGDVPWAPVPAPITGDAAQTFPINGAAWPVIDGPDAPTFRTVSHWPHASPQVDEMWGQIRYESTSLEEAANPLRAWIRSRITGFDVLDQ
jgi:hypothetical protein